MGLSWGSKPGGRDPPVGRLSFKNFFFFSMWLIGPFNLISHLKITHINQSEKEQSLELLSADDKGSQHSFVSGTQEPETVMNGHCAVEPLWGGGNERISAPQQWTAP